MRFRGNMEYLHLKKDASHIPVLQIGKFRCIIVAEEAVAESWQSKLSSWLVEGGCLYALAWGVNASSWDTSIDIANITYVGDSDLNDANLVVTTWHDDEPLSEVFWFAKHLALHPYYELRDTVVVHISSGEPRKQEFVELLKNA